MSKKLYFGEMFFAIFLFSGVFKESLNLSIDISALFLVLTGLSILYRLSRNTSIAKYARMPLFITMLIFGLLLFSYMFTPSQIYATEKIIKFAVVTMPAIVFPFFLFKDKQSIVRFLLYLSVLSVILSAVMLPSIFLRGSSIGFIGFNDGNYQGLARLNGVALIILIFLFLIGESSKKVKLISFFSIILVSFVLFSTGSRMPLVAFALSLIYALYKSVRIKRGFIYIRKGTKVLLASIILGSVILVGLATKGFFDTIIYRFSVLFTESSSADGRTERMESAFDTFQNHVIFGGGIGSFPLYYSGLDASDYPHNIVLEILSELGLVGLFIFSLYFILSIYRGMILKIDRSRFNNSVHLTVICLFIYYLANSMVSGDINSNRALYVFMSIMCIIPFVDKDYPSYKSKEVNESQKQRAI
ncbi:O-antigen ligase family protein [Bacillus sp. FJAT-49705]|uniref:O-antigen ligase family protein n=1 Tax=Cytobacillus citreus TaxID=2833586 RepID=A0ABS5NSY2_9BACI|nr:O-antigen ligase family protein [Cytobacillus citreus]MBS4190671.1 O-antigen ligase family protein [Cytobacillus citreus]